ncbi:MAG: ABC transporter permease [Chloroflexota bacterium]
MRLAPHGRVRSRPSRQHVAGQSVRTALGSLLAHKFRSSLTMIGIILGVCGVLTINAVGQSQNAALAAQLAQLGSNLVSVASAAANVGGVSGGAGSLPSLTVRDAQAIREQVPDVAAISPGVSGQAPVVNGRLSWGTSVQGVYPEYQVIANDVTRLGAFFTAQDEAAGQPVAVLGQTVADHVFPATNPLGAIIRLRNVNFRVVGVLAAKGHNGQRDLDDVVLIPFSTGQQRLFGYASVGGLLLQVDSTSHLPGVLTGINRVLRSTRHIAAGRPDDFRVTNYQQLVDSAGQEAAAITMIMSAIAAVALTLGGFGLMNIMLMAVTDPTTEIGVRMAVGAQPGDVLLQFLSEAATLTIIGGLLGVVAGFAASAAIPYLAKPLANYPAWPAPGAIAVALGVSLAVGLLFGLYPAHRAAHLNPIEALRYE